MTVQLNFDASTVDPVVALEAIPNDDYVVALTKAEPEATKAGDAHYLHCVFVVQEGQYKGRQVFKNLNLWNPNTTAVEIAWRELSGLCHAAGVLQVATVDQLFGIPVIAKVIVEADPKYGASNRIKAFTKMSTGPAPGFGAAPTGFGTAPGGPTAPDASAPWNQPAAPSAAPPAEAATAAPPWGAPGAQPAAPAAPVPTVPSPPAPAETAPAATAPPWAANAPTAVAPGATPPWAK